MSRLQRLRALLRGWPATGTFLADEVALCGAEWRDERAAPQPPVPTTAATPSPVDARASRLAAA